jgi:hypothetical protein
METFGHLSSKFSWAQIRNKRCKNTATTSSCASIHSKSCEEQKLLKNPKIFGAHHHVRRSNLISPTISAQKKFNVSLHVNSNTKASSSHPPLSPTTLLALRTIHYFTTHPQGENEGLNLKLPFLRRKSLQIQ